MSSFFTVPGAQKKRKRAPAHEGPSSAKRVATTAGPAGKGPPRPPKPAKPAKPAAKKQKDRDESISGSDSESDGPGGDDEGAESGSGSDDEAETAADKRLKLAEQYLAKLKSNDVDEVGFNAEDVDRDLIAERLQEDVAESKGRVYRKVADQLSFEQASHTLFRANTLATTSVAICHPYCYTVSKDQTLIKWKLRDLPQHQFPQTTKKKPKKTAPPRRQPEMLAKVKGNRNKSKDRNYTRHTDEILCCAASQDGKFVVTGGADRRIIVYDAKSLKTLKVFGHNRNDHRDAVTGLAFRRGTNQLFSSSKDRTVKVWSLNELAYVETLFGHQDEVVDVDTLAQERCVSVGARDRTARLWKVVEESQLVFRGGGGDKKNKTGIDPRSCAHEGSMDRIAMLDEDLFVTGGDNGAIALWSVQKKKPLFVSQYCHGLETPLLPTEASAEQHPDPKVAVPAPQPRWITALRALPYSDVILSGSWDGHVRAWKLSEDKRKIEPLGPLDLPPPSAAAAWAVRGVVNDISVFSRGERGAEGLCVVAAVGKEHRLGRWKGVKGGKNGAVVFEVPVRAVNGHRSSSSSGDDDDSGGGGGDAAAAATEEGKEEAK